VPIKLDRFSRRHGAALADTSLALDDYRALLDWTGPQTRASKPDVVPADRKPNLERLHANADAWLPRLPLGRTLPS
jgi:hypothetical protein